jgi:V/A-type H+-transporting ATPase subunit E
MGGVGSIDNLRSEILKQAKEQSAALLEREKRIAERDLEFAKEDAEKFKEQQKIKAQSVVDMEKRKIIASAEMEARRILLEKKEDLVSKLFIEAKTKLEEMRGSDLYINVVSKSIENAASAIGENLIVEFCENDKAVFTRDIMFSIKSRVSKAFGSDIDIEFKCIGNNISAGVIIKSKDERLVIDNSFSSLIKRLEEDIRGNVSEILLDTRL